MSIDRKPRTEQQWRDIINDCQESGLSIRSYCLRRGISEVHFIVGARNYPINQNQNYTSLLPNLCAHAFALGRDPSSSLAPNQGEKSLAILSSFTATCQQFGINPWIYLRDTPDQIAHYSRRATPRYFANQVI